MCIRDRYYLFDPLDEYLRPRLQGFKLVAGMYQPVKPSPDGSLLSRELGLVLRADGNLLRVVDPRTGQPMPTLNEAVSLMEDALEIARSEAQRAQAEAQRAQTETQRAQAEAQRAAAAEARSAQLEAEIERLRRLLDDL